jgi:trimeric autotransporter adhesin
MQVKARAGSLIKTLAALGLALGTASCSGGGTEPNTPTVAQITLSPLTPTVLAGQNVTLSAQLKDAAGNAVTGQGVLWTTSDATIATVSGGVVTTIKPGAVTITATSGTASSNTTVTVVPAVAQVVVTPSPAEVVLNGTVQLTVTLRDAAGNEIAPRSITPVTWTSSSDAAATVSSTGQVTGKVVGAVTITATAEGKIGTTTVNVRPVVATVTVTPNPLNLVLGGSTGTLTATMRDVAGNSLSRAATWSSDNTAIAEVSSTGVVTAKGVGTATITATSEGKTGTASVVVGSASAATVTVTPSPVTVEAGTTTTLEAVVKNENGQVLTGRTVTWTSSDITKATVNASGVVTGVAVGTATITATSSEGKQGTATVNVVDTKAPVLLKLTLSPSTVSVASGPATVTISAQLTDGSGVERFDVKVLSPNGDNSKTLSCSSATPTSGSPTNGTFSCSVTFPQGSLAGNWLLFIGALDSSPPDGRALGLGSAALEAAGFTPARITVQ